MIQQSTFSRQRKFTSARTNQNAKTQSKTLKTTTISSKLIDSKDKLRIMVLGGLEEVGRNMTLIEYNKEIIIIDMGIQFPEEDTPGIDYIIPNIDYLKGKEDWIKGVVITHGHIDHIGAIPHIMGEIKNPPMFTGKLTASLIRKRCEEFQNCPKLKIGEINEKSKLQLGHSFKIEFLRLNHSIPDCFGVIIQTPLGIVVHTGDFKIDYSPVNDAPADLNKIALIGGKKILLLMSDSTGAAKPGYQISESKIGHEIDKIFEKINGRIIIGTFASQLSRIQKIFDLANKYGRKICLQGRSMNTYIEIAHQSGYLKFYPQILINDSDLNKFADDKIVILGTGAQAEDNAFLMRVVNNDHRSISLKNGDTVIFSSSVIPGNERSIQNLKDMIVRQGAKVIHYEMMDVHAGGHAQQEDLKLMMRLLKPENFMPIEANHYMLKAHAELAEQVGIPRENIFIADNGQVLEFSRPNKTSIIGRLTKERVLTDYVMVDGLGVGDVSHIVLRDRRVMAADGMIVAIATIDSRTGDCIGNPDIISRGFIYMKENKALIEKTRMRVKNIVKDHNPRTPADVDHIKNKIRNDINKFLFSKTKRRPMVLPVVIKV
ncbi:MAG: ribonuclease J [Patescibacteria group bacterium]|nr:ribonuclease J [Patescibacteria group bacterium]MBU1160674.1 ribonuclease J [Patescibacteria group bacterium]MBU1349700.1 ribonuclease J [Patescibacteria group bacterium]MBU1421538.1 ribonuclease J [Patescibacteria group bacterium]MBU1684479.1 ribonuclease J [Patescibacteria group bacterium]